MTQKWQFESFDFDTVWLALSRSKQLKDALTKVAEDTKSEAESYARAVAYDEGDYKDSFDTGAGTGKQTRSVFNTRARRRRGGAQKSNRFLDSQTKVSKGGRDVWQPSVANGDPDGGAYNGTLVTVVNTDFKALWIEFGSLAKGPRRVLLTAAQKVVNRLGGASFEVIYDANYQQDLEALGEAISKGIQRRKGTIGEASSD